MVYNTFVIALFFFLSSRADGLFRGRIGGSFSQPRQFLEGNPASCEKEGAEADLPFPRSPCIKCFCQGGRIACKLTKCPSMHECRGIVVQKPGECCRECQESDICLFKDKEYKDGDSWFANRCRQCRCDRGRITCENQVCDTKLTCPKGKKKGYSPGACCESCIEDTGMCTSFGDPHYQTFDNRMYNFQGKCKYVFTKDCATHNFTIHVRNEGRHSRTFSWTKSVFLHFNGIEVALLQKLRVKVNGKRVGLPYLRLPDLRISENGYLMTVVTSIGVEVVWDGDSYTEVHVPKRYMNKTCGFCGNFNNDHKDDFKAPDGTLKATANEFGKSWKVKTEKRTCETETNTNTNEPPCLGHALAEARRKCSVLKGPRFSPCHNFVNPKPHYESCVLDMCHCRVSRGHTCKCQSLTAYQRACKQRGKLVRWKPKKHCNIRCKGGAVYDDCGPACPLTCDNKQDVNKVCLKPCVAGCQCPAGKVWHRRKCILPSKCPNSTKAKKKRYFL